MGVINVYEFILNERNVSVSEDINLLKYLRDNEDLTSVKMGVQKEPVEPV